MRWADVDLDNAVWTIPDTKNNTAQTILLTGPELEILQKRFDNRKKFDYVFPGTGTKSPHLADPKKGWHRILKRARIENLHLHDLRRTLGSYMAMTGASLSVIGNALNHKDVSTTRKVYAHSAHEAERTAREVAHQRMFAKQEEKENKVVPLDKSRSNVEF
jgi:integrase